MSKFAVILLFLTFGFCSCEKVINIPVNEADERLVVEAVLKDVPNASYVLVSKSGTVYDNNGFKKIMDAEISVSDDAGNIFEFFLDPLKPGKYINPGFIVEPNRSYHLSLEAESEIITADASSRTKPVIDSLSYKLETFGLTNSEFAFYLVSFYSTENGLEKNFYRLRIAINGEEVDNYYLGDDQYINGQVYDAQFFGAEPDLGDTVRVEILEMDARMYNYCVGLSSEKENSSFSASPGNPPSNLQGNALGYFGVFMTDTSTIIIQ